MKCFAERNGFPVTEYQTDLCVIGGGIAGICAAVSAARRGLKVVLMHDRPVLGGNASSEIRMCIRGAHGENMRETGIVEELALENSYRNPDMNFSIWDSVLFGIVREEPNITMLLNCSCMDAEMDGSRIRSVKGWQLTTQEFHLVFAKIYADCSGDSILGPLTGAEYRVGREAEHEFHETIAPPEGDTHTMGMSCLIQARQMGKPMKFKAPKWARHYTREDFPYRLDLSSPDAWTGSNFWWMEIGGMGDSIRDTEKNRDELVSIALGVWDFIKNSGETNAENWTLEWMGFLPGKRESRRYAGAYMLTQNDIRAEGRFEDIIAYGGWTMDDHHPAGMETRERPTIWHEAPSPYGIPYRCIYSKNIENLMFAGRNISATHTANASTRVMATCGQLGQALGNAAALAVHKNLTPRQLYPEWIPELQDQIMEDGCYIPWKKRDLRALRQIAEVTCNGNGLPVLLDGEERVINGKDHAFEGEKGCGIVWNLKEECRIEKLRLVFDSDLNRNTWENQTASIRLYPMKCHVFLGEEPVFVPKTIVKSFQVYIQTDRQEEWESIWQEEENYQRQYYVPVNRNVKKIKCVLKETWGSSTVRVYAAEPVLG